MAEHSETTSVDLPTNLVERVERRLPHTEFASVDAYAAFVIDEVLFHIEDTATTNTEADVDEDQVRSQLRALGYVE